MFWRAEQREFLRLGREVDASDPHEDLLVEADGDVRGADISVDVVGAGLLQAVRLVPLQEEAAGKLHSGDLQQAPPVLRVQQGGPHHLPRPVGVRVELGLEAGFLGEAAPVPVPHGVPHEAPGPEGADLADLVLVELGRLAGVAAELPDAMLAGGALLADDECVRVLGDGVEESGILEKVLSH